MTIGIYRITNIKNGKYYIGSSKNIEQRWMQHKYLLNNEKHHSYKLQRDWKEFKEDSFKFEILDVLEDEKQLKEYEQYWLDTLEPYKTGYNILKFAEEEKSEIQKWNDEHGGFVFFLFRYGKNIFDYISQEYVFKLFYFSSYLNYNNELTINRKEMKELSMLTREHFSRFLNTMIKLGIIFKRGNIYQINKQYFIKGVIDRYTKQYNDFTRIYINSVRYLYENIPVKKHKQLGAYFKIIPYIHRQQNTLCWNPDSNVAEIKLMSLKELASILGYHENSINRLINTLMDTKLDNGESIVAFISNTKNKTKSYIILNPRIFYGGNFDLPDGIKGIIKWFR